MPLYEYKCRECDTEYEELVSASSAPHPACPKCHSQQTDKKMSSFAGLGSSCSSSGFS